MPITGPIPLPGTGMDAFLQQLKEGQDARLAQQKLQQEILQNQSLNEYRKGELDISRGQLGARQDEIALNKQKFPLTMEYLKSQIGASNARAKKLNMQSNLGAGLTQANITANQKISQAVDNALPLIEKLTQPGFNPGQTYGKFINPSKQAGYVSQTSAITDSLLAALGLPKTNESIELTKKMVEQHPFESLSAYNNRIKTLSEDLKARKKRALNNIKSGLFQDDESNTSSNADTNWKIVDGELVEA